MIRLCTGEIYKCVAWNCYHTNYGDNVELTNIDHISDLLTLKKLSDNFSFFISFQEFNNKFELYVESKPSDPLSLSGTCTCGLNAYYGYKVEDIASHSSWCDIGK